MKNNIAIARAFKSQHYAEAKALLEESEKELSRMNGNVAFSKGFDCGWDAAMDFVQSHSLSTSLLSRLNSPILSKDGKVMTYNGKTLTSTELLKQSELNN